MVIESGFRPAQKLLPNLKVWEKNMPNFILKFAQKDVRKYKVKFTCRKIDEKILQIIPIN